MINMSNNKLYTLNDVSKGKGEYGIGASAVPFAEDKYTYLRITDINDDGSLNKKGLMSVDDKDAHKYVLCKNDIVFARTGNSTGRSYFYDGTDGTLVYAGFLIKFSLDEEKVNPRILKYYTHSKPYYDWVKSFDTGGTRGNINAKTYGAMPILLPSRNVQDRIVEILKSLDDKIEVNRRINEQLEELAGALFKSWFVDFEPFKDGEFVDSELGMIPKGWKVGTLSDILYISKNSVNPSKMPNCIFHHYSIPAYDNGKREEIQEGNTILSNKFKIDNKTTLFSKLNPRIKRVWFVDDVEDNSICSTEFIPYKAKDKDLVYFVNSVLSSDYFYNKIMSIVNGATGSHQRFHPKDTLNFIFAYDMEVAKEYNNIVKPIITKILKNQQEIIHLSTLRDTLLPKLMSGEIDVNEVEI